MAEEKKSFKYQWHVNGSGVTIELPAALTGDEIWELNFQFAKLIIDKMAMRKQQASGTDYSI